MALIPNFETKTADARKALPKDLPLKDAIFSLSRLGIVLRAFETYDIQTLKKVLADKIHEPYRKNLIHEYDEVRSICENIESYGFFISGSGSTLINILVDETKLELIKEQFKKILKYNWKVLFTKVDKEGTTWKERNVQNGKNKNRSSWCNRNGRQRTSCLLENHPYFEVVKLAASKNSAGKRYGDLMANKWKLDMKIPEYTKDFIVEDAMDVKNVANGV